MKERPILFSGPMVRAILAGTKTQTRRIGKGQPTAVGAGCPYGNPGDFLWVKETWCENFDGSKIHYRADGSESPGPKGFWRPSIFMRRAASRIKLEITAVRVEQLQDISEADARAEGVETLSHGYKNYLGGDCQCGDARMSYMSLWEKINGAGSWEQNPWVWVVEFKKLDGRGLTSAPTGN